VLETGQIVLKGTGEELLQNKDVRKAYLGEWRSRLFQNIIIANYENPGYFMVINQDFFLR